MKMELGIEIKFVFGMEAFVERIFSVCGLMTTGRLCNVMCKNVHECTNVQVIRDACILEAE